MVVIITQNVRFCSDSSHLTQHSRHVVDLPPSWLVGELPCLGEPLLSHWEIWILWAYCWLDAQVLGPTLCTDIIHHLAPTMAADNRSRGVICIKMNMRGGGWLLYSTSAAQLNLKGTTQCTGSTPVLGWLSQFWFPHSITGIRINVFWWLAGSGRLRENKVICADIWLRNDYNETECLFFVVVCKIALE